MSDVDTLAHSALVVVPFDGRAMRGVFGRDSEPGWEGPWPDVFQPDQADSDHADAVDELGAERGGQEGGKYGWINVVVDEDPAVNHAADDWDLHRTSPSRRARFEAGDGPRDCGSPAGLTLTG